MKALRKAQVQHSLPEAPNVAASCCTSSISIRLTAPIRLKTRVLLSASWKNTAEDLAAKPRWLVFNKIDLLDKAEAEEKAKAIAEALGWEDKYYLISAASGLGVKRSLLGCDDLYH